MFVYCLLAENSQISVTPTASISEPPLAPAAEKRDPVAPPRVTGMWTVYILSVVFSKMCLQLLQFLFMLLFGLFEVLIEFITRRME